MCNHGALGEGGTDGRERAAHGRGEVSPLSGRPWFSGQNVRVAESMSSLKTFQIFNKHAKASTIVSSF